LPKTDFFGICDDKIQVYPSEVGLRVGDSTTFGELLYRRQNQSAASTAHAVRTTGDCMTGARRRRRRGHSTGGRWCPAGRLLQRSGYFTMTRHRRRLASLHNAQHGLCPSPCFSYTAAGPAHGSHSRNAEFAQRLT